MEEFDSLRYLDWYHYLNCGYRLPAVAGTDKMGAYMPAGANRVYAYLGQEEFNYPNFAKAVRAGNTFATSGPLLMFHADGRSPGGEITLGAGGGTIEVTADAQCFVPIHRLEVIFNGKVVASKDERAGARTIHLAEKIQRARAGVARGAMLFAIRPHQFVAIQDCRAHLAGLRAGLRQGSVFAGGRDLFLQAHRRSRRCTWRRSPRGRTRRLLPGFARSIPTPAPNCTAACTSTACPISPAFLPKPRVLRRCPDP